MWNLPTPEMEPVFFALTGGFLPTVPSGKYSCCFASFVWLRIFFFFLIFLLCPTEGRILVPQPGIEPKTPAVEARRLKPLDRQGSPETLTFKGSLVSGKPSP